MNRIYQTIEALDKATAQVMIETKFVEVTDRDIRNIGVNWASLQGMQFGVRGINQTFTRGRGQSGNDGSTVTNTSGTSNSTNNSSGTTNSTSNSSNNNTTNTVTNPVTTTTTTNTPASTSSTTSVVVTGTSPSSTTTTTTTSGQPNTSVTTTNTNTTTTGSDTSSTSVTNSGTTGSTSNIAGTTASTAISNLLGLTNTNSTNRVASAVFSSSDFNIILSALKSYSDIKLVSNPTVVTLNNTEAFINIGEEFPIPNYTYNAERGAFEVSGFTYKPIGVILKVTPQVNAQGLIKLTIEPEVSQRTADTSFGGAGGASIPVIATRKAKTYVQLQNGFTMGIGGLITTSRNHGGTKVPVLGDIPGLGRLFSSKSVNDSATNLLIFLTASTVSADGASPEEVFDPSGIQAIGGLTAENMPNQRARR
jgi:type II secretory pathway component GspD/PulD (secretin)